MVVYVRIKMHVKEIECKALCKACVPGSTKGEKYLDHLSVYERLKDAFFVELSVF